ncbi:MAG: YdhR family protein [Phycisphaerales bacterium]|nr:YdhR family protein [Phycisphaerales bacterium]
MHILVINFNLNGVSRPEYEAVCDEVAGDFAECSGLISKYWLANEETNTYGGVYVWKDEQSMLDYKKSELFDGIENHPAFANVTVTDFEVLASPTKITHGVGA